IQIVIFPVQSKGFHNLVKSVRTNLNHIRIDRHHELYAASAQQVVHFGKTLKDVLNVRAKYLGGSLSLEKSQAAFFNLKENFPWQILRGRGPSGCGSPLGRLFSRLCNEAVVFISLVQKYPKS